MHIEMIGVEVAQLMEDYELVSRMWACLWVLTLTEVIWGSYTKDDTEDIIIFT